MLILCLTFLLEQGAISPVHLEPAKKDSQKVPFPKNTASCTEGPVLVLDPDCKQDGSFRSYQPLLGQALSIVYHNAVHSTALGEQTDSRQNQRQPSRRFTESAASVTCHAKSGDRVRNRGASAAACPMWTSLLCFDAAQLLAYAQSASLYSSEARGCPTQSKQVMPRLGSGSGLDDLQRC